MPLSVTPMARAAALAVAACVALAACSGAAGSKSPASVGAGAETRDWPTAGHDLANTRATTASSITAATVSRLKVAWQRPLPGAGSLTTVPIDAGGTIYVEGASGKVFAVDAASGTVRWSSSPTGFDIGPFGVAVGSTDVYAVDGSTGVIALRRSDGSPLWTRNLSATKTTGVDIQPLLVDGNIIASTVPVSIAGIYASGDRGVVYDLDAASGAVRWSFDTVQGDLWGHPEVNSGGGAWYPPAVDLGRGVVYVGTANPAPFPGTTQWPNGTSRPGANLYTDSVVALDLHTGALRWYHQVTPHDLYDRDQVHTLLATLHDGRTVVVSAGKSGVVVGLNPDTGAVLWQVSVGDHHNDQLPSLTGPTSISPGTYGGILTPPSTAGGIVYVATLNAPAVLSPAATAYFGAKLGVADGDVVAIDAADGHVLWTTRVPGDPLGGTTVVNDLVFTALLDGTVVAMRRDNGTIVWTYKAPGGINGWMSVTGNDIVVPLGNANPPELVDLRAP